MRKLFILTLVLLSFQLGITQTEISQFLKGSWELSTSEGNKGEYAKSAVIGNRWHFLSSGQLIMENDYGNLTIPIELKPASILLQNQELPIEIIDENRFFINDKTGDALHRVGFKRLADVIPPTPLPEKDKLGKLRLDGFYYYVENLEPVTYHYYRFYDRGELLEVSSVLNPTEIIPFLNQAYFSNKEDLRWNIFAHVSEEKSGLVYRRAVVPSFSNSEEKLITTLTFTPHGDTLGLAEVNRWENKEQTYGQEYNLIYHPSKVLATWRGQALTKSNPGLAEELFFLEPLPASNIVNKRVEEMPRFPGCEEIEDKEERNSCAQMELLKYIYVNIKYPAIARENGVEGTVVVSFVVEKNGSVSNIQLARDIGGGCGEESIRIVKQMQTQRIIWTPGKMYGEAVRVQFNLPIKFKLEGGGRKSRRRGRG